MKRFIVFNDTLYLVFADKVISFSLPKLGDAGSSLIMYDSHFYQTIEMYIGMDVVGYARWSDNRITELYYDDAIGQATKVLDFRLVPGQRSGEPFTKSKVRMNNKPTVFVNALEADLVSAFDETRRKRDLVRLSKDWYSFKVNKQSFFQTLYELERVVLVVSQQKNADETADEYELCIEVCHRTSKPNGPKTSVYYCFKDLCFPTARRRKIEFLGARLRQIDLKQDWLEVFSLDSNGNFVVESKLSFFYKRLLS